MLKQRRRFVLVFASAILAATLALRLTAAQALPSRLTDQEFWKLVTEVSETNGFFRSDNLLSNEVWLQYVIPDVLRTVKPGRVYMGVGPEQNFTYIAAVRPRMAFIVDVRRGNRDLHLMYKSLLELSADRADFVSRLFSKKRPDGLTKRSSISEIFDGYWYVDTSEAFYNENLAAIRELLVRKHGFALSEDDLKGIEYVYK